MHGTAQPRFPEDEGHTQILFLFPRMAKGLDTRGTGILRAFSTHLKDMRVMSSGKS